MNIQKAYYHSHVIKSFFNYNKTIQTLITMWKQHKDKRATKVLGNLIKEYLPKQHTFVFPPSFSAGNQKNHIEILLDVLKIKYKKIFIKTTNYKQSKLKMKNKKANIALLRNIKGPLIIFDDIYTSGKTIKKVIDLLEEAGHLELKIFIIATNQNID